MAKNMSKDMSKPILVALVAAVAVVITAGSLIYQANAQTEDKDNTGKENQLFEKGVIANDVFKYANLDIDGSVNITQQVADQILSSAKIAFPEAATTAADAVDNGKVLDGRLGVINGFLVYNFRVVDEDSRTYLVIVDAGNGEVLHKSEPMDSMPEAVVGSILGGPIGFSPFQIGYPGMGAVKVVHQEEN